MPDTEEAKRIKVFDEVSNIFKKHFGEDILSMPLNTRNINTTHGLVYQEKEFAMEPAISNISMMIYEAQRDQRLPIKLRTEIDPVALRRSEALRTLRETAPAMVGDVGENIKEWTALDPESYADALKVKRHEYSLWERLITVLKEIPDGPTAQRASSPRSRWHPTAIAFTVWIESGFRRADREPPPRRSASSKLVLAVCDLLLKLPGIKPESIKGDMVRKVLTGKSQELVSPFAMLARKPAMSRQAKPLAAKRCKGPEK